MSELADDISEVHEIAAHLSENLPSGFEIAMLTLDSKIPFKLLSYREALFYRFTETFVSASECIIASRPVSTALLTRSSMETLARMKELQARIENFFANCDSDLLDEFIMKRLFGSRNIPDSPDAANILGAVDGMSDLIPTFRSVYDSLSEYCHPNYSGTFGTFAKIDRENFRVDFDNQQKKESPFKVLLPSLIASAGLMEQIYNRVGEQMHAVNDHYENAD